MLILKNIHSTKSITVTHSTSKKIHLKVKDHSVSKEDFELVYNETSSRLETVPKPDTIKLPDYYKSEDYISHTDSRRNLFEQVYHLVKRLALKRKLNLINKVSTDGKTLLDFGCGTGDFLQIAGNSGWVISGIEPNPQAREIANSKTNNVVFNADHLITIEAHSLDVISLWHVLEHVPEVDHHFEIFKKLLKPNGTLIIAVPNYNSYDAAYYQEFWAAYDVPRHLWHFSQQSMKILTESFEMKIDQTIPMRFDAYYVSLLSEKYKSGTMNFIGGVWTGWRSNSKARRSGEYSSLIYVIKNR